MYTAKWKIQGTYSETQSAITLIDEHPIDHQVDPIKKALPLPHLNVTFLLGIYILTSEVVSCCLPQYEVSALVSFYETCAVFSFYILKFPGSNTGSFITDLIN